MSKEVKITKSLLVDASLLPYLEWIADNERLSFSAMLNLLIRNELSQLWPGIFQRRVYRFQLEARKNQSPV